MKTNLNNFLGPGCYPTDNNQRNAQKIKFKTIAFDSEIDRFYLKDKGIPGPGTYTDI